MSKTLGPSPLAEPEQADHPLPWRDTARTYGRVSRGLHWTSVVLLALSFGLAWSWDLPGRGPLQNGMVDWHRSIGLSIGLITLARVAWRVSGRRPRWALPMWTRVLSTFVQGLLLLLLLVVPLVGWAYTNAGGLAVTFAGFRLPTLVPRDQYLAEITVTVHEWAADLLLVLVAVHVAGAVSHLVRPGDPMRGAMF